jgi:hypothetical protein
MKETAAKPRYAGSVTRKVSPLTAILLLCYAAGATAVAAAEVVYGPKTFTLTAGRPQSFSEAFSSREGGCGAAVHTLRISNGPQSSSGGSRFVSSARVVFDGIELLNEQHFRHQQREWSFTFTPKTNHALEIHLKGGKPGSFLTVAADRESQACGPHLTIDSPAAGAVIETKGLVVTGSVERAADVGVSVNGVAADLHLAGSSTTPMRWSALVGGAAGPIELQVTATDGTGARRQLQRTVTYIPRPEDINLVPNVTSGVAPLNVSFAFTGTAHVDKVEVDFGNGTFITKEAHGEPFTHTYPTGGLFNVRFRAHLQSGAVVTGEIPVTVHTFAAMNQLLRARWTSFTSALTARDVEEALRHISPGERTKYEGALRLIRPTLPEFASGLQSIYPVWIRGSVAHYLLTRTEDAHVRGYYVYFARDSDGLWKVTQF